MTRLDLKLLPPVVTLLAAGGMALTAQYLPTLKFVVKDRKFNRIPRSISAPSVHRQP